MKQTLPESTQRTFRIVALLATVMVVGIHFGTTAPESPRVVDSSAGILLQEWAISGIFRVAVPCFAIAAGFFYFCSHDGSIAADRQRLVKRVRTLAVPYILTSAAVTALWYADQIRRGENPETGFGPVVSRWLLHPPAEQMWFLRDLMVLILAAPLIGRITRTHGLGKVFVAFLGGLWFLDIQPMPMVGGWYLVNMSVVFFFTLGCWLSIRPQWLEKLSGVSSSAVATMMLAWFALAAARVSVQPNFDHWYVTQYDTWSLILHQVSILVGCMAFWGVCSRVHNDFLIRLSGGSFFVYLVHYVQTRPILNLAIPDGWDSNIRWLLSMTLATTGCYALSIVWSQFAPRSYDWISGGRRPDIRLPHLRWRLGSLSWQESMP